MQPTSQPGSDDFDFRIQNRFRATADNVTVTQARIGIQLDVGFIQGKLSNIYYKCTDGWIKLVLRSTSFVVPRAQPLCRSRGVGKTSLLLEGETDISVG